MDLEKLEQLAKAATPKGNGYTVAGNHVGIWKRDIGIYTDPDLDNDLAFARGPMLDRQRFANEKAWRDQALRDAAFIAAANPETVLALVRVARAIEVCIGDDFRRDPNCADEWNAVVDAFAALKEPSK